MSLDSSPCLRIPTHFGGKYLIVGVSLDRLKNNPDHYPRIPVNLIKRNGLIVVEVITPGPSGIFLDGADSSWEPNGSKAITSLILEEETGLARIEYDDDTFSPPSNLVIAHNPETGQMAHTSYHEQIAYGIQTLGRAACQQAETTEVRP